MTNEHKLKVVVDCLQFLMSQMAFSSSPSLSQTATEMFHRLEQLEEDDDSGPGPADTQGAALKIEDAFVTDRDVTVDESRQTELFATAASRIASDIAA